MRHASYMHPPICTQSTPSWTNALCDASGEAHAQVMVCSSHEAIEIEPCGPRERDRLDYYEPREVSK